MLRSFLIAVLLAHTLFAADTVAVLPLFNQSKAPNLDWIGESVGETIRESLTSEGLLTLAREDRLEVYRRLSIRPNAPLTRASVMKVGEALDAAQVIFGDYEVMGPPEGRRTIRITVRIINLKRTREGPEFVQSGPLDDLSPIQTKLAWQFVHALAPKSSPTEEAFLQARKGVRLDAVENYVRGLLAASPEQKQKLFSQAAKLDDKFSEPCFQLGRIFQEKKDYRTAAQWLEKVTRPDSHYFEAVFLLGLCHYYLGDFDAAIKNFQTVAAEVPLNEVFNNLGAAQSRKNLFGAEENFKKALQGDEADPDYWFNLGYLGWKSGTYFAAADKFRAVLDRSPTDTEATAMLGRCLRKEGPRTGDTRTEGRERIKTTFEETAFRQLQAEMKK